jgi:hypothetical protein
VGAYVGRASADRVSVVPGVRDRALKAVGCAQRDVVPRLLSVPEGRMAAMSERVSLGAAGKQLGVSGGEIGRAGYTRVKTAWPGAWEHGPAVWLLNGPGERGLDG